MEPSGKVFTFHLGPDPEGGWLETPSPNGPRSPLLSLLWQQTLNLMDLMEACSGWGTPEAGEEYLQTKRVALAWVVTEPKKKGLGEVPGPWRRTTA